MRRPRRRNLNVAIFVLRGCRGAERAGGRAGLGRRLREPNAGHGEQERRDSGTADGGRARGSALTCADVGAPEAGPPAERGRGPECLRLPSAAGPARDPESCPAARACRAQAARPGAVPSEGAAPTPIAPLIPPFHRHRGPSWFVHKNIKTRAKHSPKTKVKRDNKL
nr:oleosin-B6-like [Taeniopygia guttata]